MAGEDLSLGELQRNQTRQDREMEAIRGRITDLARESVTVTQFAHEMGSLRRELASDRAQQELLAQERHKTTMDRLDRIETQEANRGMSTLTKIGVFGSLTIGILSLIASIVIALMHH